MKRVKLICTVLIVIAPFVGSSQSWNQIQSGTTKKLNAIDFPSNLVGYIGGNDSLLLKTINGGLTWNPVNFTGVTFYPNGEHIVNLKFVSENVGFMTVGPYSGTYKTTDGGSTWESIDIIGLCFNYGLYFFDENNGFLGGSGCFQGEQINKLTNGTWQSSTVHTPTWMAENMVVDFDFFDQNYGLGVSSSGHVLRTTNSGLTWDTLPTPDRANKSLTSVLIIDANTAFIGYTTLGFGVGLMISNDGGLTWQDDWNSATFFYPEFQTLHKSANNFIYAGGFSVSTDVGMIYENNGDLVNWNYQTVDNAINGMSSHSDSVVFAVGDGGYIVVNKALNTLGLEDEAIGKSKLKVYPNPTRNVLNIQKSHLTSDIVSVNVLNLKGEIILSQSNSDNVEISDLNQGVYIIEINTVNNKFTERFIKL